MDVARQRREPCFDRVDSLPDAGEAEAVDDPFDRTHLFLDGLTVPVGNRDRGGQVAEGDMIAAERLERLVGIENLVVSVAVEQLRRRSEEHTSELQSLMRTSYAVFCLKKK